MSIMPRRVRYFQVLAFERHFGRAATRLGITQSALSQQMNDLQKTLGCRLVSNERGESVELTLAGEEFAAQIGRILEPCDDLIERARALDQGKTGRLRIGYGRSGVVGAQRRVVSHFQSVRPDVQIDASSSYTADDLAQVRAGERDLAFVRDPGAHSDLEVVPLQREELVIVVGSKNPLFQVAALTRADILDATAVCWPRHLNLDGFDRTMEIVWGPPGPETLVEESDIEHAFMTVRDTCGCVTHQHDETRDAAASVIGTVVGSRWGVSS